MNKFVFWALFGLVLNTIALIRGAAQIIEFSIVPIVIGAATLATAFAGLYASFLILRRNAKGFDVAKVQVWFFAAVECAALFLGDVSSFGKSDVVKVSGILAFIFASQLSKLFGSEEAKKFAA